MNPQFNFSSQNLSVMNKDNKKWANINTISKKF